MSMNHVGADVGGDFGEAPRGRTHLGNLTDHGQAVGKALDRRRPEELPVINGLVGVKLRRVLGRRQMERLPAPRTLVCENRQRAKDVAALQRQRMVENVKDAHTG